MQVDCETTSTADLYKIIISSVVPRPIAWISTLSKKGVRNLAPFSFFNAFSVSPPVVGIGIGSKIGVDEAGNPAMVDKDTFKNIKDTGEFVVNIVSKSLAEQMNQSSGNYPPEEDEFVKTGLTPGHSVKVNAPRVQECKISMECNLYQTIPLGTSNLVLGQIALIHINDDSILKSGEVDPLLLEPVGRLGGISYCSFDEVFEIPRPVV